MAKTGAERARTSMARRREQARKSGLCITCCRHKPFEGLSICGTCRNSNARRKRQYREDARIRSLFNSANPEAANLRLDALLSENRSGRGADSTPKLIELHLQRARNYWIDCKTEASLPVIARAQEIALRIRHIPLYKKAVMLRANILGMLGRYEEAQEAIDEIGTIDTNDDPSLRIDLYVRLGNIEGARGERARSYNAFEEAARIANEDGNSYLLTVALGDYALQAIALGDLEKAKSYTEQALFVARKDRIMWRIAHLCLDYANLLRRMGDYRVAHEYLLEALSYDARAPMLDVTLAAVGIPIALHVQDRSVLARCAQPKAIELAFQAGEPARIGVIAAAFAQLYGVQREHRKARTLVHRAVPYMRNTGKIFEFSLEVARVGTKDDVETLRAFLQARLALPHAKVAEAHMQLFNALLEQRSNNFGNAAHFAGEAITRFKALHWYESVEQARLLLPRAARVFPSAAYEVKLFSDVKPALTRREEEVAGLVLRGLTNREIAETLNIREHTVEKHMTSIMNRMGIRSRHQLIDSYRNP